MAGAVQSLNANHKNRACALVSLTDIPAKGAPRGVQDDDDNVMQDNIQKTR